MKDDEKEQGRQMGERLAGHAASHFQRTTSKNRAERREGLLPAKYTPKIGQREWALATAEIYEIAERLVPPTAARMGDKGQEMKEHCTISGLRNEGQDSAPFHSYC